jgi:hypothetical protein
MRKLKNTLILFSVLNLATACLNDNRSLENLGSTDDFNQQEIDPDFEAPEDETEAVKSTCSGFVDTESGNLNVRTDSNTKSTICAKLPSKTSLTIALEGHKDGFIKITTPKCDQAWVYVSEKYVGLGSDCPFKIEETVPTPKPAPTPTPEDPKEEVGDRTPDSLLDTFYIERQDFNLANGKAKRWDGCESGYKSIGGYNSDSRCGRAFIHKKFSENLNEQFYKCVFNAADTAGYAKTQKVFINHLGSYNDRNARNSSRKSNHAYARALDIKHFNLVDSKGKVSKVSTLLRDYKGSQAKFYDNFRDCWRKSMPSKCRSGQSEYKGSIGHKSSKLGGNTLHNDHIHLSFPLCAG